MRPAPAALPAGMRLLLCVGLLCALARPSAAVDYHWTGLGKDGLWSSAANWDQGIPQGPGNAAYLDAANGWSNITLSATDNLVLPDMVFGPEWGATLDIYGQARCGSYIVPVQWNPASRSLISLYSNATFQAEGIALGDSWWYHGAPYVTMSLYGNAKVCINWLYWGGRLNLYDNSVFSITNGLTIQTTGSVSDATRAINLAGGVLLLPPGFTAQVKDWIARGILLVEDTPYASAQISIEETSSLWPNRTVVTTTYLGQMQIAMPFYGDYGLHDPGTLIKDGANYYIFGDGQGILAKKTSDLRNWTAASAVFTNGPPSWTTNNITNFTGYFWAPDIAYFNGRYNLYYACSQWGTINSAIGLATSSSLNSPAWTDQGKVIESNYPATTNTDLTAYNCIDPSILVDTNGTVWMAFGSYSDGILIMQLDPSTGKRLSSSSPIYRVANNGASFFSNTEEAACLYQRGGYYYLFVNFGGCCSGWDSTYNIRVGRSTSVAGPYYDKNGLSMTNGGGTMVLESTGRYIGPGHAGILNDNGTNWLTYHYYDGANWGAPAVGMSRLYWTADGWPAVTNDWSALYPLAVDAREHRGIYSGSLQGGAYITNDASRGNVLNFDGISQHVLLPNAVANARTFAAWVKWNGGAAWQRIFDFGRDTTNYFFLTPLANNGVMRFAISTNGASGREQVIDANLPLPSNSWCHVAVTLDGSRGVLYLNGLPVGTNNAMALLPRQIVAHTNYLGRSQWAAAPFFRGRLSAFRVFGRALSPEEVHDLALAHPTLAHRYSFTRGARDSIGMAHGQFVGDAVIASNALKLTGISNSYINLPGGLVSGSSAVTLEFWGHFGTNGAGAQVLALGNTAGYGYQYLSFSPHTSANGQRIELVGGSTTVLNANGVLDNRAVCVACIVDPASNYAALYTNGVLEKAVSTSWPPLSSVSSSWSFIGRSLWSGDAWLNGLIDELRIYDGRLSPQEIAADFQFGPDTLALPISLTQSSAAGTSVLSWPAYAGFTLETTSALGQPWSAVAAAPSLIQDQWQVVVPRTNASRFFRLRR
jgi:arabinan endo-1,5-alpha-L-arabinosidase